jgi:hypothetical protein
MGHCGKGEVEAAVGGGLRRVVGVVALPVVEQARGREATGAAVREPAGGVVRVVAGPVGEEPVPVEGTAVRAVLGGLVGVVPLSVDEDSDA